jgi:Ser/Thr protein kinase RdoA (MazF antagonist)
VDGNASVSAGTRILRVPRPSRVSSTVAARFGTPVIDPSLIRVLLARYGIAERGSARNIQLGRRNRNMTVITDAGRKVVKMYRPQWTEATVRYGHSILTRLEELNFPAPRLARTLDGADHVQLDDGLFALFDFVPGVNYSLNFLLRRDRLRLTVLAGRTLALFHRYLDGFAPAGEHHMGFVSPTGPRRRDLEWHRAKVQELTACSAEVADADARSLSGRLTERASAVLDEIAQLDVTMSDVAFPRLVIHGDYGIHNLIYQPTGIAVPVDFELSRLDLRLNDLISALVKYRYTGGRYDLESMEAFLGAYASRFALSADERRLLPDAWRSYKLQQAVQYWNSYFETGGPNRKLVSALDSIDQADWVTANPMVIQRLASAAEDAGGAAEDAVGPPRSSGAERPALG